VVWGVIVPYRNQIATVRNTILRHGISELADITIDTVERYQGSQRKYIIYGFTIQHHYQLRFLTSNVFEDTDGSIVDRKLNVAMTRAEESLIMVGNPQLLVNNFTFFKLIEYVRSRHGYFEAPLDMLRRGIFRVSAFEPTTNAPSESAFTLSPSFRQAFHSCVLQPVKERSGSEWPARVMGLDHDENLESIGYGRINIANQLTLFAHTLTPERQVLTYCYYLLQRHYCGARNLLEMHRNQLAQLINATSGRVQFIDVGCGPSPSGIAFRETFEQEATRMAYTGIDTSAAMLNMSQRLIAATFPSIQHCQWITQFCELGTSHWEACSALPCTVVFSLSHFFSNVKEDFAERLAFQMAEVMHAYPLNNYIYIVQQDLCDGQLAPYRVFRKVLADYVDVIADGTANFSPDLPDASQPHQLYYSIWVSQ